MKHNEDRYIEIKAKNLLASKDIPKQKLELVRSLLKNNSILSKEKYSAIIELIQNLPDKKTDVKKKPDSEIDIISSMSNSSKNYSDPIYNPAETAQFIDELYNKYKDTGLFRKRYLIRSSNFFGFSFKKRLIPSKRLFKILKDITTFQEKLLSRLPQIMDDIIGDPVIEDPSVFNYLRQLRIWLLDFPFSRISYDSSKWLDSKSFEYEIRNYIKHYISFGQMDSSIKENIIMVIESKLREMSDLKKDEIQQDDTDGDRSTKEKNNLKKEKIIYDYTMTIRSFLHNTAVNLGNIDLLLKNNYNIPNLGDFIFFIAEALVFKRPITYIDINRYFKIMPLQIKTEEWECSGEYLKKFGKDPESKKKRHLDLLNLELEPYDDLAELLSLKINNLTMLIRCFEEEWHIINRRKQDSKVVYENNFFTFMDNCSNFFTDIYKCVLDGSRIVFEDSNHNKFVSSLFSLSFFEREFTAISNIQNEILNYRTNNPSFDITRDEAKRILNGQIKLFPEVKAIINQTGYCFYNVGKKLHAVYIAHREWLKSEVKSLDSLSIRRSLPYESPFDIPQDGYPFPFHDCCIEGVENKASANRIIGGKSVIGDSIRDSIIKNILAFCFQLAAECHDDNLSADFDKRKEILRKIKELEK